MRGVVRKATFGDSIHPVSFYLHHNVTCEAVNTFCVRVVKLLIGWQVDVLLGCVHNYLLANDA